MKFSVTMANFNNAKYLPQAIESVIKQTYKDWELVIVDDKSTDNSLEVIAPYLTLPNIKLIKHIKNLGAAAANKTAIESSAGEIVGRLDPDDALTPDALSVMAQAHQENPLANLIYSTYFSTDNDLKILIDEEPMSKAIPVGKSLIHAIYVTHFSTFKRKFYDQTEGINPYFKRALDQDLFLKLEEVGEVVFVDKPLYYYRRHSAGISQEGNSEKARMFHIMAMYDAYKRRKKSGVPPTGFINLSQDEMHYYLRYYCLYQAENNTSEGVFKRLSYLFKDLSYIPKDIKRKDFWQIFAKVIGIRSNDKPIIRRGNIIP
jgi:glycosyltransferase involved in cell wall biosynthesis